ncbi:MAG: DUF3794 domain-containing protein [Clostridia bacterium]|nr:DUF3794 domain-containing protein [Clostridia bacterium]
MNEQKDGFITCHRRAVTAKEISGEYTLPDYLPDINRVLRVSSAIGRTSSSAGAEGGVDFEGETAFSVIYSSPDGLIKNAAFTVPFSGNIQSAESIAKGLCHCTENTVCRLQSPRRIVMKCRVVSTASVPEKQRISPVISGKISAADEAALERKEKTVRYGEAGEVCVSGNVSEDVEIEGGAQGYPQAEEIVAVSMTPCVYDAKVYEGRLVYKGDVITELIVKAGTQEGLPAEYYSLQRTIPISGDADAEGLPENTMFAADCDIYGLEYRVSADAKGEARIAELDFEYAICFRAFTEYSASAVGDIYSPDYETVAETARVTLRRPTKCLRFNFTTTGEAPRDESDFDTVVSSSARVSCDGVTVRAGRMIIQGTADINVILGNGAGMFTVKNFKAPLRYETDGALPQDSFSDGSMVDFDAFAAALSVKPRISRDTVSADVETAVSLLLFTGESSDIVVSCNVLKDRPREKQRGGMRLYYPEKDETLWDIAKTCATTESALKEENGITGKEIPVPVVVRT